MAYNVLLLVVLNTTRVLHVEPRNFSSSALTDSFHESKYCPRKVMCFGNYQNVFS